MQKAEYIRMAERETSYWWHLGRLHLIEAYLKQVSKSKKPLKILNVGCGTGGTISLLERYGMVDNVDVSDDAIAFTKQRGYSRLKKVDGISLPYEENSYDLVVAFDVLEHIDDDHGALQEWRRVLKDGGMVLITVPAYRWLWTEHDVSLQHFRRYTRKHLRSTLEGANLNVQHLSHAFVVFLPLIVGFRFLHKLSGRATTAETSYVNVAPWINTFFIQILKTEAKFHPRVAFPAGTSIIASSLKHAE